MKPLAILTGLLLLLAMPRADAVICRVTTTGVPSNHGNTWSRATTLQDALGNGHHKNCTEIWIATGVYTPVIPADPINVTDAERAVSFAINRPLKLYGGFAGYESRLEQRNPKTNVTVLSGDIDHNDCGDNGCPSGIDTDASKIAGSNSYHVIVIGGTDLFGGKNRFTPNDTTIDGFVITAGDAHGLVEPGDSGGGIFCNGGHTGNECSPSLTSLSFFGNRAYYGGALVNAGFNNGSSNPTLSDVGFSGNEADVWGGAIINNGSNGISSPTLNRITFRNNTAYRGGAIYNDGRYGLTNPKLTNVTFIANRAENFGGAVYNDGFDGISNPTFTNVTFTQNAAATFGGAIFNEGYYGTTSPILINVILWKDVAFGAPDAPETNPGPEVFNFSASVAIYDSIVNGSGGSGSRWNIPLSIDGGGNLDADPRLGPLTDNGGFTLTMVPGAGSAAIDAGTNTGCPTTDQRGVTRPQDGNGDGLEVCDIGAVEYGTFDDTVFTDGFEPLSW